MTQSCWKYFTDMKMHGFLLTWLHHMGMGPSGGAKQQAGRQTVMRVFVFLSSDVRATTRWLWHTDVCVLQRQYCLGYSIALICVCERLCGIIYSLHLSHSAFLAPLFTCASWGQDQAWAVETSPSKFASPTKSIEGTCKPGANVQVFAFLHLFIYQCILHKTSPVTIFQTRLKNDVYMSKCWRSIVTFSR